MYRVTVMSGKIYALDISEDIENEDFKKLFNEIIDLDVEGTPSILVTDLDDLYIFGLNTSEIKIVKRT